MTRLRTIQTSIVVGAASLGFYYTLNELQHLNFKRGVFLIAADPWNPLLGSSRRTVSWKSSSWRWSVIAFLNFANWYKTLYFEILVLFRGFFPRILFSTFSKAVITDEISRCTKGFSYFRYINTVKAPIIWQFRIFE